MTDAIDGARDRLVDAVHRYQRCVVADDEHPEYAHGGDGVDYADEQVGLAALELVRAWQASDSKPVGWPADPVAERLAELENTLEWHTTCTSCARVLDSSIRETARREEAEEELARLRERVSLVPAGDYEPDFGGAFCTLCGSIHAGDLGATIGICLDGPACRRRSAALRRAAGARDAALAENAALRTDAAVLARNWHADRDKLVALRSWATTALGSPLWEQALAIFEMSHARREDECVLRAAQRAENPPATGSEPPAPVQREQVT